MTLQGLETEFGFSALDLNGMRCDQKALGRLIDVVRQRVPTMHSARVGIFLGNGGLLYIDAGDHLEWATPECTSPAGLVKFLRAGEKIVAAAAGELEQDSKISRVQIYKSNVCYTARDVTWGCHESYLYRNFRRALPAQLIPFLVSRVIFTGAGGLSTKTAGIRFELSPRVAHLEQEISCNSTDNRAIFHTKNESLTGFGYKRLHLICGDSNCSQFQSWLKIGTTMLIVAMVDAGIEPGAAVNLESAVDAMQRFSADATCSDALVDQHNVDGVTALAIQRSYLEVAERYIGTALMPDWAEDVCIAWRSTLDTLEADPSLLVDKLDWPLKRSLFRQRIENHAIGTTENVDLWNSVLFDIEIETMKNPRHTQRLLSTAIINQYRRRVGKIGALVRRGADRLKECGFGWDQLDEFLQLRWELCELDMSLTDITDRGIFNTLDRSGALNHRMVDEEQCAHAISNPPEEGRARLRGEAIRQAADKTDVRMDCAWQAVTVGKSRLDLRDPFANTASWSSIERPKSPNPTTLDIPVFLQGA